MSRLIILIVACTLISGCITEKKAKDWAYNHKDALAGWCADCFPVKPSEVIPGKPVYLPGDTIVTIDTVRVQLDCPDGTKVDCPPNRTKTIRDTILVTDTIKIRDTAYETVLAVERDKASKQLEETSKKLEAMTDSRDKYRKWFFISLVIAGVYSILRIKKIV